MKRLILTLAVLLTTTMSAMALEPLLLEPLDLSTFNGANAFSSQNRVTGATDYFNAEFVPASKALTDPNMVPQNNAAKGLPVPEERQPRVFIQTKQGTQTNTQWNPGGKGTKSYF